MTKSQQFEQKLKTLLELCKKYRAISKQNGIDNKKEFKLITRVARVTKKSIQKYQKQQARFEKLKKKKKTDKGQRIESKLSDVASLVPLLLRDEDGNLYYASMGIKSRPKLDDAEKKEGEEKFTLRVEFFEEILLFTLKGEGVVAKIERGYSIVFVPAKEDGTIDYNPKMIYQYDAQNFMEEGANMPIYEYDYEEQNKDELRENCIGHTVTNKEEHIWINPVFEHEGIDEVFENVDQMIKDADCELVGGSEATAQKGDLIAFKGTQNFVNLKKLQLTTEDIGHYIHAAIYNGDGTYTSKNGKNKLDENMSLAKLVETYDNDYSYHRPIGLNNKLIVNKGEVTAVTPSTYQKKELFEGRAILPKRERGVSEKDYLEQAEEEMKELVVQNAEKVKEEREKKERELKEATEIFEKLKQTLLNAEVRSKE